MRSFEPDHVTAWATCASAVFVGLTAAVMTYQTWLLRQTISSPYLANLQAREIDACVDFLAAAQSMRLTFQVWTDASRGKQLQGMEVDPEIFLNGARGAALNLEAPLEKIELISGPGIKNALDLIGSVKAAFLIMFYQKNPGTLANQNLWMQQFHDNFKKVSERCAVITQGQATGLL